MNTTTQTTTLDGHGQDVASFEASPGVGGEGFWHVLWRWRRTVLLVELACAVACLLYLRLTAPVYTSTAKLYVAPLGPRVISEPSDEGRSRNFLQTQCEVICSAPVLEAALARPGVAQAALLSGRANPVALLKEALTAVCGKKDDVITVSVDAPASSEADLLVSAVVDSYIAQQSSGNSVLTGKALEVLRAERAKYLAQWAVKSQEALEFKKAGELLPLQDGDGNVVIRRLGELSDARIAAELDTILARTEYEAAKAVTDNPAQIRRLAERDSRGGLPSDSQLSASLHDMEVQLAAVRKECTDDHPAVQALQARIAQARRIQEQAERSFAESYAGAVKQKLDAAQQRESYVKTALAEQLKLAEQTSVVMARAAMMEYDLKQAQKMAEFLDARISEVELAANLSFGSIRLLEDAICSGDPTSPKPVQSLAVSLGAGLLLGIALALVRNRTDNCIRSSAEVPRILRVPLLGAVPSIAWRRSGYCRQMAVMIDPASPSAEAFRDIRTALYFDANCRCAKTLLVTSSLPREGKTTVASNLAIAMAQTRQRTLLIDADLRRGIQHDVFSAEPGPGVLGVVAGEAPLSEAIKRTAVENLEVLPAGQAPDGAAETLSSPAFAAMLKEAGERYDRVIVDSPPLASVTDGRILGAMCDAALLVVRAEKSTRQATDQAIEQLLCVGANLLGVVINDVPKNGRRYGNYGRYGDYRKKRRRKGRQSATGPPQVGAAPESTVEAEARV